MPLATSLLGTHVRRSSSNSATSAEVLIFKCKTEVGNERLPRAIDQNIGGLDVAMDQPRRMSMVQGLGDGGHQCRRLVKTGTCFLDPGGQVASLDVLGHDEAQTVFGAPDV